LRLFFLELLRIFLFIQKWFTWYLLFKDSFPQMSAIF